MPHRFGFALVALLSFPFAVNAAGLGRLAVSSILGQPLEAEIEIVSVVPAARRS